MKRIMIISMIAFAVLATPALADLTTQIKITAGPRSGSGGAFWAEVVLGNISYDNVYIPTGEKFLTFCVENNESLALGETYWIDIETAARLGGTGGNEGPPGDTYDPLDPITAALYARYLNIEDPTDVATADKYQLAIWKLEEEAVWDAGDSRWEDGTGLALSSAYNAYTEGVIDTLISTVGTPSDIGAGRVMTLWARSDKTGYQQDLLVVPVPAAVILAIIGLGISSRKLRKYV